MDSTTQQGLAAQAAVPGSGVARGAERCLKARQNPASYSVGGWQGFEFVFTLSGCLASYKATGNPDDLATAIKYWNVLLDDYQKVGDGAGGDTVVSHDTGYAIRTFAPYSALAYDWLHDAPGVTEQMRAHARARFAAWFTYYQTKGYLKDMPGANYQAGWIFAATLMAIAEGGEAGATGDAHWAHVRDQLWAKDMATAFAPGGVLSGGDWLEGWQYAPLSVLEYSLAGRALADNGLTVSALGPWTNTLVTRFHHGLTPATNKAFAGGDVGATTNNLNPDNATLLAVIAGPSSEEARGHARKLLADIATKNENPLFDALAQARAGAATPMAADAPRSYFAEGAGNFYSRSSWAKDAVWSVFQCSRSRVADHQHMDAGNFVLTRGADDVVVDPSPYGSLSTLTGNAPAVDSKALPAGYSPSQAVWGKATRMEWTKQLDSGVSAARCDYADQFQGPSAPSDVASAVRDFVMIPSGQNGTAVLIDRVVTGDPTRQMHLRVRSPSALSQAGDVATATVGSSSLAVRKVYASAGASNVRALPTGSSCSSTNRGTCDLSRIPSGSEYRVDVPGPNAMAIHVVDAQGAGSPAPASELLSGAGYRGVRMVRGTMDVSVITNDTPNAAPGASLGYRVPASAKSLHVVVDAPTGAEGKSDVSATLDGADCKVTVTPHAGATGGVDGAPLTIELDQACKVQGATEVEQPASGGGGGSEGGGQGAGSGDGSGGGAGASAGGEDPSATPGGEPAGEEGSGTAGGADPGRTEDEALSGHTRGCSAGAGAPAGALPMALLGLGVVLLRRRRERRS